MYSKWILDAGRDVWNRFINQWLPNVKVGEYRLGYETEMENVTSTIDCFEIMHDVLGGLRSTCPNIQLTIVRQVLKMNSTYTENKFRSWIKST